MQGYAARWPDNGPSLVVLAWDELHPSALSLRLLSRHSKLALRHRPLLLAAHVCWQSHRVAVFKRTGQLIRNAVALFDSRSRRTSPPWPRLHGFTDRIGDHMAWRPTVARTGAPWVCGILSANSSTILSVSSDADGSRIASSE